MGSLRTFLVAGARSLDLAPRRAFALLLVVALAAGDVAPRSAQSPHAATLRLVESAESGLEEQLRAALAPAAIATGLEEGEKPVKSAPGEASRRDFLKMTTVIPRIVKQAVAGVVPAPGAVPVDAKMIATARAVAKIEVLKRVLSRPSWGWPWGGRHEVTDALAEVAAELQSPTFQSLLPPDVETAIRDVETGSEGRLEGPEAMLVRTALRAPSHHEFARVLMGLQEVWRDAFQFPPAAGMLDATRLLDAYVASGSPPLVTDVQRRAYLRPILQGYLNALVPERSPRDAVALARLLSETLEHAERIRASFYHDPAKEWEISERLHKRFEAAAWKGWGPLVDRITRRWSEAGVSQELQNGFLRAQLDSVSPHRMTHPDTFVDDMALYGRFVASLEKSGFRDDLAGATPEVVLTLSPKERAIALQDPDAWAKQMMQRVQAQRADALQDLWAQWNLPRALPTPRVLSRAEAEDVTLQVAERWGRRIGTYGRLPWTPQATEASPAPLTVYTPVSWADGLTAHWTLPEREATAVRAILASTSGPPGVLLLDETMPIPLAVVALAPSERPVILRVTRQDLPAVTYHYLAFLASQPALRGQVLLWVPAFATPVTLGDSPASYYLATEA